MSSITAPRAIPPSQTGFGARFASLLFQPLSRLWRSRPDARRVALVASVVSSQPSLCQWLLIVASEPPRVRRALLSRAVREMRATLANPEVADVMEQLADERLLRAVTEALFLQSGLQPPARPTGRDARIRLAELGERLERPGSSLAA